MSPQPHPHPQGCISRTRPRSPPRPQACILGAVHKLHQPCPRTCPHPCPKHLWGARHLLTLPSVSLQPWTTSSLSWAGLVVSKPPLCPALPQYHIASWGWGGAGLQPSLAARGVGLVSNLKDWGRGRRSCLLTTLHSPSTTTPQGRSELTAPQMCCQRALGMTHPSSLPPQPSLRPH